MLKIILYFGLLSMPLQAMEQEIKEAEKEKGEQQKQPGIEEEGEISVLEKAVQEEIPKTEKSSSKPFYKNPTFYGIAGVATAAVVAAAAYAGLELWQRWQIKNVLNRYKKTMSSLNAEQKFLMIAAYKKDINSMRGFIDLDDDFIRGEGNEWVLPAMTELYFGQAPTTENIKQFELLFAS